MAAGRCLASVPSGLLCKCENFLQLRYARFLLNELFVWLPVKWLSLACVILLKVTVCLLLFEKFAELLIPMTRILHLLEHVGHHCPTGSSPSTKMTITGVILIEADWLVIMNHSIFEKARGGVSDYLVTQRKTCSCQIHASSTSIQPAQAEAKSFFLDPWETVICKHHLWVTSSYFFTFFTWGF